MQTFPPAFLSSTAISAFVLGTLALMFATVWWRDREQGLSWLALGFGLMALVFASNDRHMPIGPYVTAKLWSGMAISAIMLLTVGIVEYLPTEPQRRRWILVLLLGPGLVLMVCYAVGIPVLRAHANLVGTIPLIVSAWLAFSAAHVEKGAGHIFVGLALLSIPAVGLGAYALGVDAVVIRYYGAYPLIFFGLTLFTTSLLRNRRALQAEVSRRRQAESQLMSLNQSLEEQVAQRTADLQSLVAGLESFNRNVSHDLRGPLGGIAGTARLALDALESGNPSLAKQFLPIIADQADTSGKLVSALLELAHVGDASLHRQSVDLRALVDASVSQIAMAAPPRSMPEITVSPLPTVQADVDLLRPVLVNLIGNARKFTQQTEHAHIEIGALNNDKEVTVFVRDNGVGFNSDAARKLFEPFVRLHGQQFEGTGVGLSIVRKAVERHGGRVWAESAPKQGATFYFTLPHAA